MFKVGDELMFNDEEYVIYDGELNVGEVFKLVSIENTFANIFYWIENKDKNLVLTNDEINAFEVADKTKI